MATKQLTITFNDDTPDREIENLMMWIIQLTDLMNITAVLVFDPDAPQEKADEQA